MKEAAKILLLAGSLLLCAGVILFFMGDKLKGLGHLPGDIRIEKPGFRFYAPVTTMLLLSLVLSLLLWLIRKLF